MILNLSIIFNLMNVCEVKKGNFYPFYHEISFFGCLECFARIMYRKGKTYCSGISLAFFYNTKALKMMIFHHTQLSPARQLFWGRKVLFKYLPSHINNHGAATNANIFLRRSARFLHKLFLPFLTQRMANKLKNEVSRYNFYSAFRNREKKIFHPVIFAICIEKLSPFVVMEEKLKSCHFLKYCEISVLMRKCRNFKSCCYYYELLGLSGVLINSRSIQSNVSNFRSVCYLISIKT